MALPIRVLLVLAGAAGLLLTAGFFFQAQWATSLWPLPASRLSNIFIASILAAATAPVIWIGLSGETRALAGGALNFCITYGGVAAFTFGKLPKFASGCGVISLCLAALFFWTWRKPLREDRPTPRPVLFSFGLFAIVLALVGSSLALGRPHIFPWPLSPETSAIYGWIFLGAMCYFVYALGFSQWGNARGQLLGFLAYDLVLIGPYLSFFEKVKPDLRLNLILYVSVIVYSALVSVYYLFIHRETRFFRD